MAARAEAGLRREANGTCTSSATYIAAGEGCGVACGGGSPGLGLAGFERMVDDAGLLADRLRDPGTALLPSTYPGYE